jgi:hypothetical protein
MSKAGPVLRHKVCKWLPPIYNPYVCMSTMLTLFIPTSILGMERTEHLTAQPPTATKYKVGDLVHVFQGTAAYVRGRNTVAFIGRVVGYNELDGKWEIQPYS